MKAQAASENAPMTMVMIERRMMNVFQATEDSIMEIEPHSSAEQTISDATVPLSVECWDIMSTVPRGRTQAQQNVTGA